jgi:hypothetical protein
MEPKVQERMIYMYIYTYIYMCVCVCVYNDKKWNQSNRKEYDKPKKPCKQQTLFDLYIF